MFAHENIMVGPDKPTIPGQPFRACYMYSSNQQGTLIIYVAHQNFNILMVNQNIHVYGVGRGQFTAQTICSTAKTTTYTCVHVHVHVYACTVLTAVHKTYGSVLQ